MASIQTDRLGNTAQTLAQSAFLLEAATRTLVLSIIGVYWRQGEDLPAGSEFPPNRLSFETSSPLTNSGGSVSDVPALSLLGKIVPSCECLISCYTMRRRGGWVGYVASSGADLQYFHPRWSKRSLHVAKEHLSPRRYTRGGRNPVCWHVVGARGEGT